MRTRSWIASSTTRIASILPATACADRTPARQRTIDRTATRCQKLSASEAPCPGRHHVGILGDFISECPGDFVGICTLVERKTQLAKITKLPRATARATQKAAVRRLKPIGDFVHTITFDNGKEFAGASGHRPCTENQNLLRHAVSRMGARFK
jgi:hypothetical protein